MSYQKQGFHSGGKLQASQLVAMEDGIINAEKLATELKNDASHIYDKQEAFEAITWDGVIGDREVVTMPNISEACMVKLSDVILTREDYIGSRVTAFTPYGKESLIITEDLLYSKEEEEEQGIRGTHAIITVIDVNKANLNGANFQTTGTYGKCIIDGSGSSYVKSLSKTTIEIKEGSATQSGGFAAHAQGVGTKAYGRASHTEGWETQTGELVTIEEGDQTYNIPHPEKGLAAHADGYKTKAIANYSQASGFETIADRDAQTVVGQYNNKTSRSGSLFVVGGGTSDSERKNALEVISDGEIVIYWEGNYYSLNNMLNLIANKFGGKSFFDLAKK